MIGEMADMKEEFRLLRQQIAVTFVSNDAELPMDIPVKDEAAVVNLLKLVEEEAHRKTMVSFYLPQAYCIAIYVCLISWYRLLSLSLPTSNFLCVIINTT